RGRPVILGFPGYDRGPNRGGRPPAKPDPIGVPEAVMIRPTIMVVFDGVRDEISVVTPVRPASGVSAKAALESAQTRLEGIVAVLEGPLAHAPPQIGPTLMAGEVQSNTSEAEFNAMV